MYTRLCLWEQPDIACAVTQKGRTEWQVSLASAQCVSRVDAFCPLWKSSTNHM